MVYSINWQHEFRRDGRVAEGTGLLNRSTAKVVPRVRIPLPPPATFWSILDIWYTDYSGDMVNSL